MTAVISVPWSKARLTHALLSSSWGSVPIREAPEVDRCYFAVKVKIGHDEWLFPNTDDRFIVHYFHSKQEAVDWGEWDIERRMGVAE